MSLRAASGDFLEPAGKFLADFLVKRSNRTFDLDYVRNDIFIAPAVDHSDGDDSGSAAADLSGDDPLQAENNVRRDVDRIDAVFGG